MKKTLLLTAIVLSVILSGCGINTSLVGNVSTTTTNVELSEKNFKVLEKVTGESSNKYFFAIGGLTNKSLIEKAKNQMMDNANLIGGSKTVINITYDTHITIGYPFYFRKTVTAAGYVVEFTK